MKKTHRRAVLGALAASATAAALPSGVRAQAGWPSRPIRVVVPFAPGGATDLIARLIADNLAGPLGQQVVVENRAGAFGVIGADAVAKAPADGYTLLAGSPGPVAVNPFVYKTLPYDPARDLAGVSMVANIPYVMVVPPSLGVRTVQDFIALARRRPGEMNFATSGMASRLTVEMFRALAGGLQLEMVQYRGGAPARTDLLAGRIQMVIEQAPSYLDDFRDGRLIPVAVGGTKRFPLLPDVPTLQEAGIAGYEANAWLGYVAPAGTPMEVRRLIASEIDKLLRQPAIRDRLLSWGAEPVGGTPEEMDRMLDAERKRWSDVVRMAGIEKE
ncbi:Bug family tripartite tricarboxylate transporter substrate binding protein [Roseomonas xinghualingensis]|uniref:Bug family tripartite tricarboxylate transporter substrate binding protein n=1 Tax=Roseomonas xinghualingensis TaxID=2986475 RepID=UPI0021F0C115|nr:tripartite tricarboxylate transporter substrate binding protein [Roseomonas sp. SXEYE001]MCV4208056.1 tripartite tricarboxylate transporter substrate binding protein [Roseomonas sp. SXEYE001]